MERRHTPGPWTAGEGAYSGGVYCDNALGSRVAIVYGKGQDYSVFSSGEEEANAALIAAAPDLLHALLCLKEWVDDHAVKPAEIAELQTALAAIAKAEGHA